MTQARDNQHTEADSSVPSVKAKRDRLRADVEEMVQSHPETLGWLYWSLLEALERL